MSNECSRCGASPDGQMDAICVSKTAWGYDQGPSVTTDGLLRGISVETVVDEEKRWDLRLCKGCLLAAYVDDVQRAIHANRRFLTWAPVVLFACLGFFGLFGLAVRAEGELPEGMIWVPLGFLGVAAVCCGLGIPITAVELWTNRRRLRKAQTMTSLPQRNIKDAFNGEAHRILHSLENGRRDYYGQYDLPQFSSATREGQIRRASSREVTVVAPKN